MGVSLRWQAFPRMMTPNPATTMSESLPAVSWRGADDEQDAHFADLPPYSRSLLRIEVPVVVTLASTRHAVSRILELGPGTILHFDKPYDEPLVLSVGRSEVAVGEAVKVGDKFGLRISSMVLPQEKFEAVRPKRSSPSDPG
jgi:flagellar motor switch/type III secretory pathway protein FliN